MEDKLFRVGIYLRLSDEDQNKVNKNDNSESIKNQRHLLMEEINKKKEYILVDEYCDENLSGAGTYRPEFERLIKDCENKKIDIVLCKSQSRFSRDLEVIEKYLHNKFTEWNIRFIGLADNTDTFNVGNKKARQINGLVNEWYLEDVSNNIKSAFHAKMKQGEFISPFACFGYEISKIDNNKLVIDPIASKIVKCIFNLYLKGFGYTSIANKLNKNNIPSPSLYKYQKGIKLNVISNKPREEIKWNANAIKTILTNEIYLGHLIQGKRTTISYKNHKIKKKEQAEWIRIENTHEKIINEDIFYKVQLLIKQKTKPLKKNGLNHLFSGKVFCLNCNHLMRKKNSNKYCYLFCPNCKNNKSIRYDILEKIILLEINNKLKHYFDINILKSLEKELLIDNRINNLEKERSSLLKEISCNKLYLNSLYEDKVKKVITNDEFNELVKIYNQKKDYYNSSLEIINNKIKLYKKDNNNLYFKYKQIKFLNKFIIDEFIDKIYISNINKEIITRDIKIKWTFN